MGQAAGKSTAIPATPPPIFPHSLAGLSTQHRTACITSGFARSQHATCLKTQWSLLWMFCAAGARGASACAGAARASRPDVATAAAGSERGCGGRGSAGGGRPFVLPVDGPVVSWCEHEQVLDWSRQPQARRPFRPQRPSARRSAAQRATQHGPEKPIRGPDSRPAIGRTFDGAQGPTASDPECASTHSGARYAAA